MDIGRFSSGSFQQGYEYRYFRPAKINQSFTWSDPAVGELLEKASLKLGELNAFSRMVPDTDRFIMMHVYKEAVDSSWIEGTQTNIEEVMIAEPDSDPERRDDWKEVNNYVEAMNQAIVDLDHLPLSNRLLQQTHKHLLASVRGARKSPGAFRLSQNWIGGSNLSNAVFIPPVHDEIPELMADLEKFLNNQTIAVPHLIKIAIAHYQFETIHPFLDGNGRIGRLMITLYLVSNEILGQPLLYLSDYLQRNKHAYYESLMKVRLQSDLGQWILFFLEGIVETAEKSVNTLMDIIKLKEDIEKHRILSMGKRSQNGMKFLESLFRKPVTTIKEVEEIMNLSTRAAGELVRAFEENDILVEATGHKRNRVFRFVEYLKMFS